MKTNCGNLKIGKLIILDDKKILFSAQNMKLCFMEPETALLYLGEETILYENLNVKFCSYLIGNKKYYSYIDNFELGTRFESKEPCITGFKYPYDGHCVDLRIITKKSGEIIVYHSIQHSKLLAGYVLVFYNIINKNKLYYMTEKILITRFNVLK